MTIKDSVLIEAPLGAAEKAASLLAFADRNGCALDRGHTERTLEMLDNIRVTRLKGLIARDRERRTVWVLLMTVNDRKTFRGDGDSFEEALVALLEGFERFLSQREERGQPVCG